MEFVDETAILVVVTIVWLLVGIVGYAWYAWALSQLFKRLGTDAWRGWVPILNEMTIFERGGIASWKALFLFFPVVNLVGLYLKFIAAQGIGRHFGRGTGMAVLAVLVSPLWATMLVLQRVPATGTAPASAAQSPGHRQVAGGMASSQAVIDVSGHGLPATQPPVAAPFTPTAPSMPAPSPAPEDPWTKATVPAPPMPEPAPPVSPPPGPSTDSGPIVVHNPWARPVTATPAAPVPSETATWINDPDSASAPAPQHVASAEDDDDGETIVVDRRPQVRWHLNVDNAEPLPLVGDIVLLGRRPTAPEPGTQALAVPDTTRTLSKSHARLELRDGQWTITDLNSTNGVLIVDDAGEESMITPGRAVAVPGRFILGKVGMHISFEQAGT